MKGLTLWGLIISALYILFTLAFFAASKPLFEDIGPNEWGDFLAGMFGPLAFLWLVLGFFQQGEALKKQGEELNASVKQLELQAKELSASVQQQKEMVDIQRQALKLDERKEYVQRQRENRKDTPDFDISITPHSHFGETKNLSVLTIKNFRAPSFGTQVYLPADTFSEVFHKIDFEKDSSRKIVTDLTWKTENKPSSLIVKLKWRTEIGAEQEKSFELFDLKGSRETWSVPRMDDPIP